MPSHHHHHSHRPRRGGEESGESYERPSSSISTTKPVERWLGVLQKEREPGMEYMSSEIRNAPTSRLDRRSQVSDRSRYDTQTTDAQRPRRRRDETRSSAVSQGSTLRPVPQETILPSRSVDPREYGFNYIESWTERNQNGRWGVVTPDRPAQRGERQAHLYKKTFWYTDRRDGAEVQKNENWTTYSYV